MRWGEDPSAPVRLLQRPPKERKRGDRLRYGSAIDSRPRASPTPPPIRRANARSKSAQPVPVSIRSRPAGASATRVPAAASPGRPEISSDSIDRVHARGSRGSRRDRRPVFCTPTRLTGSRPRLFPPVPRFPQIRARLCTARWGPARGSRTGPRRRTTPLKKLGGLKKPPLHSGDGTRPYGSFSDQRELEPAVEEPAATESNGRTTVFDRLVEARAAVRRQLTGKKFVFTDDSKHGKTGETSSSPARAAVCATRGVGWAWARRSCRRRSSRSSARWRCCSSWRSCS